MPRYRAPEWKAYITLEECENTGGAVFAKTNAHARRLGAEQFNGGEWEGMLVSRARHLDHLYPGPITWQHLFELADFWMECEWCGQRCRNDDGGVSRDGGFYCYEHADPYVWHAPMRKYDGEPEDYDLVSSPSADPIGWYRRSAPDFFVWRYP